MIDFQHDVIELPSRIEKARSLGIEASDDGFIDGGKDGPIHIDDMPLCTSEAFRSQSPHWGSMVSPVAQIVRVKRCEHCGTAPAEVGPLCMMCEDDRREKYGI